jgi:DNA polymerase III subunit alpha, Gram-positive type
MSNLTDKRNRFELLMQQAQIPSDLVQPYFAEGYIEQVECSRTNREWTFHLVKNDLVPQDIYRLFCSRIKEQFAHIAEVRFAFRFEAAEPATLVEE